MKLGDGLFLNTCRKVAEEYKDSGIKFNDMMCVSSFLLRAARELTLAQCRQHLHAACRPASAVRRHGHAQPVRLLPPSSHPSLPPPHSIPRSATTNPTTKRRYGSIVSNIGAALVGGPGIVPGANIGREFALFEPGCRHVAKDIEGKVRLWLLLRGGWGGGERGWGKEVGERCLEDESS